MRLFGIMELQLASSFLLLLLLAWLPTGTVSHIAESAIPVQCKFEIWSENLMVIVEYKPKGLEMWNQSNTMGLGENCTSIISLCLHAAHVANCELMLFITRINSTNTANYTEETVPRCCPAGPQTNVTEEKIWTGLNLLCIFFGLSVGMLVCTPVIGFLLWQCRRNSTGKLKSREVAEGNQLTMAVPGAEDLTYANLNFQKGTKPASSNTIYTEIKPSQQQQNGGDVSAATTEVDVCHKGEGK